MDETEQAVQGDLDAEATLFLERIRPIFAAECMECHGRDTQQGGYRLDLEAVAFAGGQEGGVPAIVPNAPLRSELVRRILLNADCDTDAMPPFGNEPLSPEETLAVIDWIQRGAPFLDQ